MTRVAASILAVVTSATVASAIYLAFVVEEWSEGTPPFSKGQLLIILPVCAVALAFDALVLLPLWSRWGCRGPKGQVIFFCLSALVWLCFCIGVVHFSTLSQATIVEDVASVILPGLALIGVFQLVARRGHGSP